ncbi:MAG: mechanosensitive ion channel family protein [Deltaproteobacteria bacterium]|nr:mechanosensitive ion channel family protein [Deltaproteobacteria bacterium]
MLDSLLHETFFGNTVLTYIVVAGAILLGLVIVKIGTAVTRKALHNIVSRTDSRLDDFLINVLHRNITPLLYYGVFYIATRSLALPAAVSRSLEVLGIILLTFLSIRLIGSVIVHAFEAFWLKDLDPEKQRSFKGIIPALKVVVWGIGIVFLLDNLGFEISAVIAGLGIGGIAVALAAQSVLGDLFSYFSILMDRPFETGDFIVLGPDHLGTVEHIGIKTTRIRSLSGEQIILSNSDLTNSRIRNFKRMERRRILFKIGVTYQTPPEKLKAIPGVIRDIVNGTDCAVFDRSHFSSYGDFSLNFETVYFVQSSDFNKYMDIHQAINLSIYEKFQEMGIEFAYPTQTLYIEKSNPPAQPAFS